MKKKIIAAALALVIVVLAFSACGKDYYIYKDSDGVEHPVITNKEGNTILNEFGQIVIGVTDADGKLVTNADGSYDERGLEFPTSISNGNVFETPELIITLPEKIWTVEDDTFKLIDHKTEVSVSSYTQDNYTSVDVLIENADETMEQLKSTLGNKFSFEKMSTTLQNNITLFKYDAKLYNDDGTLSEERIQYYFQVGKVMYSFLAKIPADEIGLADTDYIFTSMILFK